MAKGGAILVGTIGQGVMRTLDDGGSWTRASVRQGMHSDALVRSLLADPRQPEVVYAGTDMGLYRSDDAGARWARLDTPMSGAMVWSLAFDPVDPTVGVIRITDLQDRVRAVLVNYACHPVVLGPRNRQISADYPGVMRRQVEQRLGADATCFFLQGCCGDINPLRMARGEDRAQDFDVVEQVGMELATSVLSVLEQMKATPGRADKLAVAESTIATRSATRSSPASITS